MKIKYIIACLAFVASISLAGAQATTSIQERRVELRERVEQVKEKAEQVASTTATDIESGCGALTNRVDARISAFDRTYSAHEHVYDTHIARLQTISSKLLAKGIDVTKFNSSIAVLEVKVEKFKASKNAVVDALEATKGFSCGEKGEEYRQALAVVKDAQKVLFEDTRDIWSYIKTTITNDLKNIQNEN